MKTKHTPGEWRVNVGTNLDTFIITARRPNVRQDICTVEFNSENENRANAKLIAAAPDLLAAMIEVHDFLGHIEPKIGEQAFAEIWNIVSQSIHRATK